jgi:hypothetical protein
MPAMRHRVLSAALLLPLLVFSVMGTSFLLWRCSVDGIARSTCCCPTKPAKRMAEAETRTTPVVSRGRCCDPEQLDIAKAPAEAARGNAALLTALLWGLLAVLPVAAVPAPEPAVVVAAVREAANGPPAGRALVVQKQALLI